MSDAVKSQSGSYVRSVIRGLRQHLNEFNRGDRTNVPHDARCPRCQSRCVFLPPWREYGLCIGECGGRCGNCRAWLCPRCDDGHLILFDDERKEFFFSGDRV